MSYIQKVLSHDEKIIGITTVHWIYLVQGALFFLTMHLVGSAMQLVYQYGVTHTMSGVISGTTAVMLMQVEGYFMYPFWLLGASYLIPSIIKYLTSEIGLTNKRLIEKRGWISVQVREFDVREISGATVDTGMLGRIFGYGFVHVDCRFITDLTLDAIPNAHRLVSALNDVREHALAEAQTPQADAALQDIDDQSGPSEQEKKTKKLQPAAPALTPQHDIKEEDHEDALSRQDVADAIAAAIPAIASKVAEELSHTIPAADSSAPTPHTPGQTANEQVAEDVLAENFDAASTAPDGVTEVPKPTLQ